MSKNRKLINNLPLENRLNPSRVKLGLDRIEKALLSIDSPHRKFNSILVAGTNGKGSTASMIASIISSSGKKVGLYTSPHLKDLEERISINGTNIEKKRFISISEKIDSLPVMQTADTSLTYFEFITLAALIYFAEECIDLAVLEIGIGGRLDATNVVNPLISVITEIDIDHSETLGNTITKIAQEKGGIIREEGIVVMASQNREAIETITTICKDKGAKLSLLGRDFCSRIRESNNSGQLIDFEGSNNIKRMKLSLIGEHQARNGAAAIESALILNSSKFNIKGDDIRKGLENITIPGRLEVIDYKPTILLDIAHNQNAAIALSKGIKENFKYDKLAIIIGILKDKDISGIVSILAPLADKIFIVKPRSERAAEPDMIFSEAKQYLSDIYIVEDIKDAIETILSSVSKEDLICITGSAITVGEARNFLLQRSAIKI